MAALVPDARSNRPATGLATVLSNPFPTPVMNPWEGGRVGGWEGERRVKVREFEMKLEQDNGRVCEGRL